jgi:hypothetical protein
LAVVADCVLNYQVAADAVGNDMLFSPLDVFRLRLAAINAVRGVLEFYCGRVCRWDDIEIFEWQRWNNLGKPSREQPCGTLRGRGKVADIYPEVPKRNAQCLNHGITSST